MIDRAALTTYLATMYGRLLPEAGLVLTDTPDGLGPVLDEVAAVVDAHEGLSGSWYQPMARYYTLRQLATSLAVNMDVSDEDGSIKLQQQFANVLKLLDAERSLVGWLTEPDGNMAALAGAIPYAGGIDVDDVRARRRDESRVSPRFPSPSVPWP